MRFFALVACIGLSTVAYAQQSGSAVKLARRLYEQAQVRAEQDDYQNALRLLDEAYIKYPSPGILYAIGIVYEKQGRDDQALVYYDRALNEKDLSESLREQIRKARRRVIKTPAAPPVKSAESYVPSDSTKWLSNSGLFLQGGLLGNVLLPSGGMWPFAAGGYLFDFGLFVRAEVLAPFATASLSVGWELLQGVLRPFPWLQAGYAFVRSLENETGGGWLMATGVGLRWLPWSEKGFWFAARAGIALDFARQHKNYPIPMSLSVGYSL